MRAKMTLDLLAAIAMIGAVFFLYAGFTHETAVQLEVPLAGQTAVANTQQLSFQLVEFVLGTGCAVIAAIFTGCSVIVAAINSRP